ncbi:MAG: futalosine hydrolase [Bacteroidetes bacterium]|nr:futalosine hydrolase [Bacteroidota bacterium]
MILIVAATFNEIRPFYEKLILINKIDDFLSEHQFENKKIDILITGIGMTSTAYHIGKIIGKKNYEFAINLGIAGAFNKNLNLGDVVNVDSDIISEMGAENGASFLKFDEMNIGKNQLDKTVYSIKNAYQINNPIIQKLPKVKGITVNTVHGNAESVDKIINLFNPDVETMEGAAFLNIFNAEKINCAQIRAISNFVEERQQAKWNIELAIEKLNVAAFEIVNNI